MKKRYQEVMLCLENLAVMLAEKELEFDIQAKICITIVKRLRYILPYNRGSAVKNMDFLTALLNHYLLAKIIARVGLDSLDGFTVIIWI